MSLSSSKRSNYILVKEKIIRKGKGADILLSQLEEILAIEDNKWAQKIVIEASKEYLYLEKLVPKEEYSGDTDLTLHQAVRHKPMEEMTIEKTDNPHLFILTMFEAVNQQGYEVSHILVGEDTILYKWASILRKINRLYGVPITKSADIPSDVIIVCGAVEKDAEPNDIECSVKGTML